MWFVAMYCTISRLYNYQCELFISEGIVSVQRLRYVEFCSKKRPFTGGDFALLPLGEIGCYLSSIARGGLWHSFSERSKSWKMVWSIQKWRYECARQGQDRTDSEKVWRCRLAGIVDQRSHSYTTTRRRVRRDTSNDQDAFACHEKDPERGRCQNETLSTLKWNVLSHPSYSRDLVPSEYRLFRSMAHGLADEHFTNFEEFKKMGWRLPCLEAARVLSERHLPIAWKMAKVHWFGRHMLWINRIAFSNSNIAIIFTIISRFSYLYT